jgi:hypothetical protein
VVRTGYSVKVHVWAANVSLGCGGYDPENQKSQYSMPHRSSPDEQFIPLARLTADAVHPVTPEHSDAG